MRKLAAELPEMKMKNENGLKKVNHYRKMHNACKVHGYPAGAKAYLVTVGKAKAKMLENE